MENGYIEHFMHSNETIIDHYLYPGHNLIYTLMQANAIATYTNDTKIFHLNARYLHSNR